jgi:hypothetical protein
MHESGYALDLKQGSLTQDQYNKLRDDGYAPGVASEPWHWSQGEGNFGMKHYPKFETAYQSLVRQQPRQTQPIAMDAIPQPTTQQPQAPLQIAAAADAPPRAYPAVGDPFPEIVSPAMAGYILSNRQSGINHGMTTGEKAGESNTKMPFDALKIEAEVTRLIAESQKAMSEGRANDALVLHRQAQAVLEQTKAGLLPGQAASQNAQNNAAANLSNAKAGVVDFEAKAGRINALKPSGAAADPLATTSKELDITNKKLGLSDKIGMAKGWLSKDGTVNTPADRAGGVFGQFDHPVDNSSFKAWEADRNALLNSGTSNAAPMPKVSGKMTSLMQKYGIK